MLYFDCVSVFHAFIVAYCMMTQYANESKQAIIFIPQHVPKLLKIQENIKSLPYIADIRVVNADWSMKEMQKQNDDLTFSELDIFHMIGWTPIGLWLITRGHEAGAKTVLIEEVADMLANLDSYINWHFKAKGIDCGNFAPDTITEVWKLKGPLTKYHTKITEVDLHMRENFADHDFLQRFYLEVKKAYGIEEVRKSAQITYFDQYALSVYRRASYSTEKTFLDNLFKVLHRYDYECKPHPSCVDLYKYDEQTRISKNSDIPWEMVVINEIMNHDKREKVYISCGITGAIVNTVGFVNESPYMVFLHKLLNRYGVHYGAEDEINRFKNGLDDITKARIFEPESFAELKFLLSSILEKKEYKKEEYMLELDKENEYTRKLLAKSLASVARLLPDEITGTYLLRKEKGQWNLVASEKIDTRKSAIKVKFDLHEKAFIENNQFRWYIVSSRNISVRINKIEYGMECGVEHIEYHGAVRKENNYYLFDNFDPTVEFTVNSSVDYIQIDANAIYHDNHNEVTSLSNKRLEKIITSYTEDLQNRDKVIMDLQSDLGNRDTVIKDMQKDLKNRDTVIEDFQETVKQLQQTNEQLEELRERYETHPFKTFINNILRR